MTELRCSFAKRVEICQRCKQPYSNIDGRGQRKYCKPCKAYLNDKWRKDRYLKTRELKKQQKEASMILRALNCTAPTCQLCGSLFTECNGKPEAY